MRTKRTGKNGNVPARFKKYWYTFPTLKVRYLWYTLFGIVGTASALSTMLVPAIPILLITADHNERETH
jgi:hypothetical protein